MCLHLYSPSNSKLIPRLNDRQLPQIHLAVRGQPVFDDCIIMTMARRDTSDQVIALQTRPSSIQEDEINSSAIDHGDDFAEIAEHTSSRRADSNKKRACVLLGSAILQFPIWGESTS
jgi:hypothetical protein